MTERGISMQEGSKRGVTYEAVAEVADRLAAEGTKINPRRVRPLLDAGGSYTTIAKHLKVWRAGRDSPSSAPAPTPPAPVAIADEEREQLKRAEQRITELERQQQEAETGVALLRESLHEMSVALDEERRLSAELRKQVAVACAEREAMQGEIGVLLTQTETDQACIGDLNNRLDAAGEPIADLKQRLAAENAKPEVLG